MNARRSVGTFGLAMLVCLPASAGDVDQRWSLSFAAGASNTFDDIPSDSANVLTLNDESGDFVDQFVDPRDDEAIFGTLEIQSGPLATLAAQIGLTRLWVLEGSVGYGRSDVGDVETQVHFVPAGVDNTSEYDFRIFRLPAGTLTQIPIRFTALARFRPRARFHPAVGAGIGYSFYSFEPSNELDRLSARLDLSDGGPARLTSEGTFGSFLRQPPAPSIGNLRGARVDARDSFEWHLVAAAEYEFGSRWSGFVDLRYVNSSRELLVEFDDRHDLGWSVPQGSALSDSPEATAFYGPMMITSGGLFDNDGDGEPDTGFHYIQGGRVDYDHVALQLGVRYTF